MLAHRQPLISSVRRDAWLEVDLNAIERNIAEIRSWLNPGTRLMAVVKSDAYGHGAAGVADVLAACGANWMGVASIDEGCQLREAGVGLPTLLLSPCPSWAISTALDADLSLTVTSSAQVKDISAACLRQNRQANLHLKIDTGMHRLGVSLDKIGDVVDLIKRDNKLRITGVFSHLAKADDDEYTAFQRGKFEDALAEVKAHGVEPQLVHLASGEAARRFNQTHYDMVRVGLYMYGLEPRSVSALVQPAMSVRGRINQIQEIGPGEAVGYNLTWRSSGTTRLASVPMGYADGVDRRLSNKIHGLVMGRKVKQVGLISMDQMLFDISEVPEAAEGDVVTLIGCDSGARPANSANTASAAQPVKSPEQLYLADWANILDTITYELACRLKARMPRMYTRNLNPVQPGRQEPNKSSEPSAE